MYCFVTGSTSGIGRATAIELARRGHHVILGARDETKAAEVQRQVADVAGIAPDVVPFDLGHLDSVRTAADELLQTLPHLDVLVNSAGHTFLEPATTVDGLDASFGVNVLGPFLLTSLLQPVLERAERARIVDLAGMYALKGQLDVDDLFFERRGFDLWRVANTTQQARVVLVEEWARRLPRHVKINAVHPGAVLTNAQRHLPWHLRLLIHTVMRPGFIRVERGAAPVVRLAVDADVASVTGRFYKRFRPVDTSHEAALAEALWDRCATLTAVSRSASAAQ